MSELEIPEAVREFWFKCGCGSNFCDRGGYTEEALPCVAAVELRRQAGALSVEREAEIEFATRLAKSLDKHQPPQDDPRHQILATATGKFEGLRFAIEELQARADELDGGL